MESALADVEPLCLHFLSLLHTSLLTSPRIRVASYICLPIMPGSSWEKELDVPLRTADPQCMARSHDAPWSELGLLPFSHPLILLPLLLPNFFSLSSFFSSFLPPNYIQTDRGWEETAKKSSWYPSAQCSQASSSTFQETGTFPLLGPPFMLLYHIPHLGYAWPCLVQHLPRQCL